MWESAAWGLGVAGLGAWYGVSWEVQVLLGLSCLWPGAALLVGMGGLLYVGVLLGALWRQGLGRPALLLHRQARAWPLGGLLFDRVALGLVAPHKALLGARIVLFSQRQLVLRVREHYWLRNPFASVDVGALCSMGELAAFGGVEYTLRTAGLRAIPKSCTAQFEKKARGVLTITSVPLGELDVDAKSVTAVAEIRDASNALCCTVSVELALSRKTL